jgi:peptidoglycan/LPS O-acetylase OafA/YrhL
MRTQHLFRQDIEGVRALDYFDQGVEVSPVVHFWSLSVEEEFYLFWTACMTLGLWVFKRLNRTATLLFLCGLALASFGAMIYWSKIEPSRAFFDTESRVWQLATGAILGIVLSANPRAWRFAPVLGWAGLMGLLISITFLDSLPLDPRVASIVPVLAMAAVLYAGHASSAFADNAVLGNAVLQWTGPRSYSLYVWHWPVLVFAVPFIGRGFALVLVFLVANLAFAWVEQPLRISAPARLSSRTLVGVAVAACCEAGSGS